MKKRFLSLLMALCLVVGLLPASALAAGDETASRGGEEEQKLVVYPDEEFTVALGNSGSEPVTIGGYMNADDWYVTDGLVLMYDGIYNAGMNRNDTNATSWKELTGNGPSLPIKGQMWTERGLNVTDTGINLQTLTPTLSLDAMTLDYGFSSSNVTDAKGSSGTYIVPFSFNIGSFGSIRPDGVILNYNKYVSADKNGMNSVFSMGTRLNNDELYNVALTSKDKMRHAYLNGTTKSTGPHLSEDTYEITGIGIPKNTVVHNNSTDNKQLTFVLNKTLHSLRLYNRALTAEEISQNQEMDRARFSEDTYQIPGTVKRGNGNAVALTEYDFEKTAMTTTLTAADADTNTLTLTLNNKGEYALTFRVGNTTVTKNVTVISEEDAEAADAVIDQINALPESNNVSESNIETIGAAQNAYNSLSDIQKARVGTALKEKLDACVEKLDDQLAGKKTFTLTYDLNADASCPATGTSTTATVTYKADYTLDIPTRPNYAFLGWWYGETQLTGENGVSYGPWTTLSNATVTARWQRAEGLGTESNPYSISNATQWYALARILTQQPTSDSDAILTEALKADYARFAYTKDYKAAYAALQTAQYKLTGDMTLTPENGYIGVPNFKGVFDGGKHTVTLNYDALNVSVTAGTAFGGLFSKAWEAEIRDLTLNGAVKGTYTATTGLHDIGVLVGYTESSKDSKKPMVIKNVTSNVAVELTIDVTGAATAYVAAMVGRGNSAAAPNHLQLINCVNNGDITVTYQNTASNGGRAAGLIGHAYTGTALTDCVNNGDVTHHGKGKFMAGGMLGSGGAVYTDCVQTGNITSESTAVVPFSGMTAEESAGNILRLTVTGTKGQRVRFGTQTVTLDNTGTASFDVPVYRNADNLVEGNAFSYNQYLTVNNTRLDWFNLTSTSMTAKLSTKNAVDITVPFQSASDPLVLTEPEHLLALQKAINGGDETAINTLYQLGGKSVPSDFAAARIALQTAYCKLGDDIDLTKTADFTGIGNSAYPFGGQFDGQGKTITYSIQKMDSTANRLGLFGQIGSVGGSVPGVRDLTVNADIALRYSKKQSTTFYIGGLAGSTSGALEVSNVNVEVKSISVNATVNSTSYDTCYIGGVFGQGSVENVDLTIRGNITGTGDISSSVGGVTGSGSVRNCTVTFADSASKVSATSDTTDAPRAALLCAYNGGNSVTLSDVAITNATGKPIAVKSVGKGGTKGYAGGLVGYLNSATPTGDSWLKVDDTVTVDGDFTVEGGAYAGGVCGAATVSYSVSMEGYVNTMAVTANDTNGFAGGLLGYLNPTSSEKQMNLTNCLNAATVTGRNKGGLVASYNNQGKLILSGCAYLKDGDTTAVNKLEDSGAAALDLSVLTGQKYFSDTVELFAGQVLPALSIAPADAFALSGGTVTFTKVGTHQAVFGWNGTAFYTSNEITVSTKVLTNDDATVTGVNSAYASEDEAVAAMEHIHVVYGGRTLTLGTDYTVKREGNAFIITFQGNYSGAITKAYTVENDTFEATAEDYIGVYDGASHSVKVTAPEGAVITYRNSEGSYSATEIAAKDAGTMVVYWKAALNNKEVTGSAVISIAPAPLTIRAEDKSVYVGDELPAWTYTVTGLVGEDVLTQEPSLTCGAKDTSTKGAYAIKASGANAGGNYTIAYEDGTLTVSRKSGGGSNNSNTTTDTVTNPDGSKTTTITDQKTGTVTETTKFKDGATLVVETKKDGTVTTTDTAANGVKVRTVARPGQDVTAAVTLPDGVDKATVTIPAQVNYGVVAKDAKTGEIVKLSVPTEDGMVVKVDGSADLVLVDNAKSFTDTDGHWAENAIDFATAHELFSGTKAQVFSPDSSMTRAMLMTVLARFDGADTTGGGTWYEKGMAWAKENGVSDGSDPDGSITREQLAAMLYRYAGSPAVSGSLDKFSDGASVSGYASDAMTWAVAEGLITGTGSTTLSPQGNATRAQVATILMRYVEHLTK